MEGGGPLTLSDWDLESEDGPGKQGETSSQMQSMGGWEERGKEWKTWRHGRTGTGTRDKGEAGMPDRADKD